MTTIARQRRPGALCVAAVAAQAADAVTFAWCAFAFGIADEQNPLVGSAGPGPVLLMKALAMVAIAAYGIRHRRFVRPVLVVLALLGALGAAANLAYLAGLTR